MEEKDKIIMLRGERVGLRPFYRDDLKIIHKWVNDHEITRNLLIYLPITEMSEEKWIEEASEYKNGVHLAIVALDQDSPRNIGVVGFHRQDQKNQDAEIGIFIGEKDLWGKGYGTEAFKLMIDYGFNELNLHRISSGTLAFNEKSLKLHRSTGFKEEGITRESHFTEGKFCDHVRFGLLKSEWEQLKEVQ